MAMQCPGVARLSCLNPKTQVGFAFSSPRPALFSPFQHLCKSLGAQPAPHPAAGESPARLSADAALGFEDGPGLAVSKLASETAFEETSVACWKGKSRLNAWKNSCVDQRTNSAVEGFRLEGIESPPHALQQQLQAGESGATSYISPKDGLSPLQIKSLMSQMSLINGYSKGRFAGAQAVRLTTAYCTRVLGVLVGRLPPGARIRVARPEGCNSRL